MPQNPHVHVRAGAHMTTKGEHPDLLDEQAQQPSNLSAQQRAEREFDRAYSSDALFRARVDASVRARQQRMPDDIAAHIGGRGYGYGGTPSSGLREYLDAARAFARQSNTILESDVPRMSVEEYDRYFESGGQIRAGYRLVLDKARPLSDMADLSHEHHYTGWAGDALESAEEQGRSRANYVVDRRRATTVPPAGDQAP
jgi:hypothetical protein